MALRYQWYAEHKNKLITHAPISRFYFNFRKKNDGLSMVSVLLITRDHR